MFAFIFRWEMPICGGTDIPEADELEDVEDEVVFVIGDFSNLW